MGIRCEGIFQKKGVLTMSRPVRRGEVYYADLSPVVGSEQGGVRPVLIIQNNVGNQHSPTTIVSPLSGHVKKLYLPTHVLAPMELGLQTPSVVMAEQIRTIDKQRLQSLVGVADPYLMELFDQALCVSCGLNVERLYWLKGQGDGRD